MPIDTHTLPAQTSGSTGCGCGGCTTCNSLKCLCRPRFFAGQLVTDADFRRLDQYLVGKDRLHNRYLHGTGVICGLEVACNPCDDTVTVRPGYALGPCGEDIVVCGDTRVDVGAMIRVDRKAKARVDCAPYVNPPATDCDAAEQRWILGICYDEQPSRPVTALRTSGSPGGCSCGGGSSSGSSGCGCGSSGSSSYTTSSSGTSSYGSGSGSGCACGGSCGGSGGTRATAAGCEPTVICEGFRFTLTRDTSTATKRGQAQTTAGGGLALRVKACLTDLAARITSVPTDPTPAELVAYCCDLKAEVRDIIETGNIHDCLLGQRLNDIVCPAASDQQAAEKAQQAITAMLLIVVDLYRECVCSALLPPCPDSCDDDCVPLATLTVRSSDLRVIDVCNWSSRRFAPTLPMIGYWLSWLPFVSILRQLVSRLCCPPQRSAGFSLDEKLHVSPVVVQAAGTTRARAARKADTAASGAAATQAGAAAPTAYGDLPDVLAVAAQYAESTSPLSGLEATVLQALGASAPDGSALASPAELGSPLAALALARLAGPAGAALGAPLRAPLFDLLARSGVGTAAETAAEKAAGDKAAGADADRLAALEETVAALQKKVTSQARTITRLSKQGGPK